jgi:CDP-diacylglycerol--glycerol-3-phosphate 3-phosphatidyltransferase
MADLALGLGLRPGWLTATPPVVAVLVVAPLLAYGFLVEASAVLLLAASLDAIDGTMARTVGPVTGGGRFDDVMADRVTDAAVWVGIIVYASSGSGSIFAAAVASGIWSLLSQATIAAERVAPSLRLGVLQRTERLGVLICGLVLEGAGVDRGLFVACVIIAIGGGATLWSRWRQVARSRRATVTDVAGHETSVSDPRQSLPN